MCAVPLPPLPCAPGETLRALDDLVASRVQQIHALELALAKDLQAILSQNGFQRLGFSGPGHYGEVRGIGPVARTLHLLKLARGLGGLATTRQAFLDGRLTTERASALCDVAQPQDEGEWCKRAERLTTPQLQQEVRAELVRRGERPPTLRRMIEFQDRDAAAFDEARRQLRQDLGRAVAEGEAIGELSRHYVECRDSKRRRMQTVRTLANDGRRPAPEAIPGARYVPSSIARAVWLRDRGRCQVPGCTYEMFICMGHLVARQHGGEPTAENLILICHAHNMLMEAGLLVIRGTGYAPIFEHHDGRSFGTQPQAPASHGPSP